MEHDSFLLVLCFFPPVLGARAIILKGNSPALIRTSHWSDLIGHFSFSWKVTLTTTLLLKMSKFTLIDHSYPKPGNWQKNRCSSRVIKGSKAQVPAQRSVSSKSCQQALALWFLYPVYAGFHCAPLHVLHVTWAENLPGTVINTVSCLFIKVRSRLTKTNTLQPA